MITHIIFDWSGTLYDHESEQLYPGVRELLARLKQTHVLGLVSRAKDRIEERKAQIEERGLTPFFASIIVSEQKTDEEIRECLRAMHAKPEETLVVDDKTHGGILAANRAGCQSCWVRQGKHKDTMPSSKDETPTFVIDKIAELAKLIAS